MVTDMNKIETRNLIDKLILSYVETGGEIKICRSGRRNKSNTSFTAFATAPLAFRGHKAFVLRQQGFKA